MIASIRDKEAWLFEKKEEIANGLYSSEFADLSEGLQELVHQSADWMYIDTMADYAESRGE